MSLLLALILPQSDQTAHIIVAVLIEVLVVIGFSRFVGTLFKRISQPLVIGEIVAGILLGPSFLGLVAPGVANILFPQDTIPYLNVLAQIGLIFFMFLIGLELNPKYLSGQLDKAVLISHVSILAPFGMGAVLALWLFPQVGIAGVNFTAFALFLGAAMSITAFPVLARIITENNLQSTKLGTLALTCAAVDDVTAWCLLAVAIAVARTNSFTGAVPTIILSIAYIIFMATAGRYTLKRIEVAYEHNGHLTQTMLALIYAGIVISALITDKIGIHFIFGAFLLGAIFPKNVGLVREIAEKTEDFVLIFLLPLFFAYSGLRTQIGLLDEPRWWFACAVIVLVATAGKYIGTYLAAKTMGVENREASALGWMMNTRGLTELIVLNIGLSLGVISPVLFAMLVIMALVTTFMTSPLLEWTFPKQLIREDLVTTGADKYPLIPVLASKLTNTRVDEEPIEFLQYKIVVPIANPFTQQKLLALSVAIANTHSIPPHNHPAPVTLCPVNLFESDGGWGFSATPVETSAALLQREDFLVSSLARFQPSRHVHVTPIVQRTTNVSKAIGKVAQNASLVLLSWHRAVFTEAKLSHTLFNILGKSPADTGILVHNGENSSNIGVNYDLPLDKIFVSYYSGSAHDDLALELGLRLLINTPTSSLTIMGVSDGAAGIDLSHDLEGIFQQLPLSITERMSFQSISIDTEISVLSTITKEASIILTGISHLWGKNNSLGAYVDNLSKYLEVPVLIVKRYSTTSVHLFNLLPLLHEIEENAFV